MTPPLTQDNVIFKRLGATLFDFAFLNFLFNTIRPIEAICFCYFAPLLIFKTTFGGIIFGIRTSSISTAEIGRFKIFFRITFLVICWFIFFFLFLIEVNRNKDLQQINYHLHYMGNLIFVFFLMLVDSSTIPFTRERLALHDFITRSSIKID